MLARKFLKIIHAVMALLVLLGEFLGKFCFKFFTIILSSSPNKLRFVRTFSIMRV